MELTPGIEVLTGQPPYRECRVDSWVISKLLRRILPERPDQSEEMSERGLSGSMWNLMRQCWSWDPLLRPQMHKLAGDMCKLHVEHMRQYLVAEGKSSESGHGTCLIFGTV
ncbi:hypothetical protein FRC10_003691 [Ceratobasidium sp. 414]|nr:hypothetical protein FRC10_003691 [Ceratobasidium sp. 414]